MMSINANLVNQLFHSIEDNKTGVDLLEVFSGSENNEKHIADYINKLLQTASSRDKGLFYLNQLLPHSSTAILSANAQLWINTCVIKSKEAPKKQHFHLLSTLIERLSNQQDFNKFMVTTAVLPKIIDSCITSLDKDSGLSCLNLCLQKYASTCGPFQNKIEASVFQFLHEKSDEKSLKAASRCFHYLQQVGGGGTDGINYMNNWSKAVKKLCATMHSQYDLLLENLCEFELCDPSNIEPFTFPAYSSMSSVAEIYKLLTSRLDNLVAFLQSMLQTKYPVSKLVPTLVLFETIRRGLLMHKCISTEVLSADAIAFTNLLIRHQIKLFYLLRSFIACMKQHLFPYSSLITKLLTDSLGKTKNCSCFARNSDYYGALYKVLKYWLSLAKNQVHVSFHNKLVHHIMEDVKVKKSSVLLTINTLEKQNTSKKAKAREISDRIMSSSIGTVGSHQIESHDYKLEEIVCINALQTLECLLKHIALSITKKRFRVLYETVIKILLSIQSGKCDHPYMNAKCRQLLYSILLGFFEQPAPTVRPPMRMCLNLFLNGAKTPVTSTICFAGINALEKLAQPVCSSLYVCQDSIITNVQDEEDVKIDNPRTKKMNILEDLEQVSLNLGNEEKEKQNSIATEHGLESTQLMNVQEIPNECSSSQVPVGQLVNTNAIEDVQRFSLDLGLKRSRDELLPNTADRLAEEVHMNQNTSECPQEKRTKIADVLTDLEANEDMLSSFNDVLAN